MSTPSPSVVRRPSPGAPSRATGRSGSVGLLLAAAVGGLAQSLAGAAGALLAREVTGSDAVVGLPQAALVAGSAVSAVVLSRLTSRWGRERALAAGALGAAGGCLGVIAAAGAGSLAGVLVCTVLVGAGTTAVMLARYAGADAVPEEHRARAMGTVLVAITVGAVAGPNLLAPAAAAAGALGLAELVGPYALAALAFTAAAGALALGGRRPSVLQAVRPVARAPVSNGPRSRAGRDEASALVVLGVANLVMVGVMTVAPVHLVHTGAGLGLVGFVVSAHVAGMFAPAPLSSWLVRRLGARGTAALAGAASAAACVVVALGSSGGHEGAPVLITGLVLLGVAWNAALVSGSVLLTAGAPAWERPRREAWGEVGMGAAAAAGSVASGPVLASAGYGPLSFSAAAVVATGALVPLVVRTVQGPSGGAR